MTAWLGLIILAIAALLLVTRSGGDTIIGFEQADFAGIVTGMVLLIFIGGGTLMAYKGQGSKALKDIAIWLAIMLALVTLYSFRFEFEAVGRRVANELMPGFATSSYRNQNGEIVVRIPRRAGGHYIARVRINGAPVEMLVDTGASSVVLTPADAERAGINTAKLSYSIPVSTANGSAMVAMVRLRAVSVGDIGARNIQAHVSSPGALSQSLLGMSFLSHLRSYEVTNGMLILRR
ncbi:MAG: TIGR02281 family clan AA aspartic protease [Hyphomicrobiaceae bacterium]|nr:TIGR02281 family clan AA aspartic protease [Hyphomicrobiaceae bacterium]